MTDLLLPKVVAPRDDFASSRSNAGFSGSARARIHRRLGVLVALVTLRLALSSISLTEPTLWMDEASSLVVSSGLGETEADGLLERLTRGENTPPLYFVVLRAWSAVSTREVWLRMLSVVAELGALGFLFLLSLELPPFAAAAGLALFASANFHIDAAQSIRFYALATMFSVAASATAVRWLRTARCRWLVVYVVSASAALATFYPAGFVVAGINALIGLELAGAGSWRRLLTWATAQLLVVISFLPLLPLLGAQTAKVTDTFWARTPELKTAFFALYPVAGGRPLAVAFIALTAVALICAPRPAGRMLILFGVPFVTQLMLGRLGFVPFHPKYLIAASPPLYLLVGLGVASLPRRSLRAGAAVILALLIARRMLHYYAGDHERYFRMREVGLKAALTYIADHHDGHEPLVHTSVYSYFPALYYVPNIDPQRIATTPLPHYLLGMALPEHRRWPDATPARAFAQLWLIDHPSYHSAALRWLIDDGWRTTETKDWGQPRPGQEFTPIRTYRLERP